MGVRVRARGERGCSRLRCVRRVDVEKDLRTGGNAPVSEGVCMRARVFKRAQRTPGAARAAAVGAAAASGGGEGGGGEGGGGVGGGEGGGGEGGGGGEVVTGGRWRA